MIGSGIIRGTDKALQYYQEEGTPIFALYEGAGKDPVCHNLKGKFDDIEESIELIKKYFNYIDYSQKKVDVEFDFLKKIYDFVPEIVPRPHAKNSAEGIALYEYIPGKKIKNPNEIGLLEYLEDIIGSN